jgi:hypothetical protein
VAQQFRDCGVGRQAAGPNVQRNAEETLAGLAPDGWQGLEFILRIQGTGVAGNQEVALDTMLPAQEQTGNPASPNGMAR